MHALRILQCAYTATRRSYLCAVLSARIMRVRLMMSAYQLVFNARQSDYTYTLHLHASNGLIHVAL